MHLYRNKSRQQSPPGALYWRYNSNTKSTSVTRWLNTDMRKSNVWCTPWRSTLENVIHLFIVLSFLFWPKLSLSRATAEMISESWVTCSGLSPITHICRAASIQTVTCVSHMLWILLSGCTGTYVSLLHYWSLLVLRRGIRLCIYQEDYAILTR